MTSMPASRRARAITFAPRSWPSRPGLATSTRIFCSTDIVLHCKQGPLNADRERSRIQQGRRINQSERAFLCTSWLTIFLLHSLDIQTPPQIPASDAAVRFPQLRDFLHLHGLGHLALVVVPLHRYLDTEVACGQHIWPPQREHQKHVCGPNTDAFDLGQMFYDFIVGHLRQTSEVKFATESALGHVAQIRRLLFRQTNRPHLLSSKLRDPFRSEGFTSQRRESLKDRFRSLAIQLLVNNGLSETVKL